jgi:hypothetical protein
MSNRAVYRFLPVVFCLAVAAACDGRIPESPQSADADQPRKTRRLERERPRESGVGRVPEQVWWKDANKVESMELDRDQLDRIEVVDSSFFQQLAVQRRDERHAYSRLLNALRANRPGGEQIEHSSEAFVECRGRRQELLVWRLKELRQILTLEQWSRLKEVAPSVMRIGQFQPFGSSEPVLISQDFAAENDRSGP